MLTVGRNCGITHFVETTLRYCIEIKEAKSSKKFITRLIAYKIQKQMISSRPLNRRVVNDILPRQLLEENNVYGFEYVMLISREINLTNSKTFFF